MTEGFSSTPLPTGNCKASQSGDARREEKIGEGIRKLWLRLIVAATLRIAVSLFQSKRSLFPLVGDDIVEMNQVFIHSRRSSESRYLSKRFVCFSFTFPKKLCFQLVTAVNFCDFLFESLHTEKKNNNRFALPSPPTHLFHLSSFFHQHQHHHHHHHQQQQQQQHQQDEGHDQ
jgi:hypothetical protein